MNRGSMRDTSDGPKPWVLKATEDWPGQCLLSGRASVCSNVNTIVMKRRADRSASDILVDSIVHLSHLAHSGSRVLYADLVIRNSTFISFSFS